MPQSLTENFRFTVFHFAASFTLAFLARLFFRVSLTHSHISGLDYVQSSISVDAMGTVALQINQYLVESFGPPGTIGTLGEVVVVAQVVLTALEFFFGGLLEAVPYGLQNDGYPPVQCGQVRFPENRRNRIGGQRLSHSLRQRFRSIVEQQQRLQRR